MDAGFAEWWAHYPRKDDKLDAKKAYVAIVTGKHRDQEHRATIPQLLAALKAHKFPKDHEFTKLPATWLNKGSWASGAVDALGANSIEMQIDAVLKTSRGREIVARDGEAAARSYLRSTLSSSPSSTAGGGNGHAN